MDGASSEIILNRLLTFPYDKFCYRHPLLYACNVIDVIGTDGNFMKIDRLFMVK